MIRSDPKEWWKTERVFSPAELTVNVLGLKLKKRESPIFVIRDWVKKGSDVTTATTLAEFIKVDLNDLPKLIGVSQRTIARSKKEHKPLGPAPTDRLARIARIAGLATVALGSQNAAARWLKTPNRVLGAAPLSLLDTDIGTEQVEEVLMRIEHGVYS